MNTQETISGAVDKLHEQDVEQKDRLDSVAKAIVIFEDIRTGLSSRVSSDKIDAVAATLAAGVLAMPK